MTDRLLYPPGLDDPLDYKISKAASFLGHLPKWAILISRGYFSRQSMHGPGDIAQVFALSMAKYILLHTQIALT